jgi:hypothetical protein
MRQPIIGVMGPGERATPETLQLAYELGQRIADAGWILLTGGRQVGVMDAASRGAKSRGGLTIGILPSSDRRQLSEAIDIPILTGMGNARNVINVLTSDVIIACGMGLGTAAEVALALKTEKFVVLLSGMEIEQEFFSRLTEQYLGIAEDVNQAIALVHQHLSRP